MELLCNAPFLLIGAVVLAVDMESQVAQGA